MSAPPRVSPLGLAIEAFATVPSSGFPGRSYSPGVLILVRWLANKPGGTVAEIARSHETSFNPIRDRLNRMAAHGIARRSGLGEWSLTELGHAFRALIDTKGIS